MNRIFLMLSLVSVACTFGVVNSATAGPILGPVGAVINTSGPGNGDIADTFNQNGLTIGYTSGVDDFDIYLGSGPMHTAVFGGFEWFGNSGDTTASVTYDLGGQFFIDALALWNEESSGIGNLNLLTSLDGVNFAALVSGLVPTNHPAILQDYAADVFGFGRTFAQYIRLDMSECPQAGGTFPSCSIGEVAFRQAPIPEPGAATLFGVGFLVVGLVERRVKKRS